MSKRGARWGITPVIGQNDLPGRCSPLMTRRRSSTFALDNGVGLLSMWSLNRDAVHLAVAQDGAGRDRPLAAASTRTGEASPTFWPTGGRRGG